MADTLATLARLRRLQATAAKRGLADALRAEAEAEAALQQAQQAPGLEARHVAAEDERLLASAFANWLARSAAVIHGQTLRADAAAQERGAASARLQAAEGALEAVCTLQEERAVVARRASLRRGQMRLDEAGARKARQAVLF